MSVLAVLLLGASLLSSPLAAQPFHLSAQADAYVWHEWAHDAGFWARDYAPWRPWALSGDKWDERAPGWARAARAGFVGQTWLAAALREPAPARANTLATGAYVLRMMVAPGRAGDFDPLRQAARGPMAFGVLGPALLIEGIVAWEDAR